jgi:uncharacterized membrane protein YfcA
MEVLAAILGPISGPTLAMSLAAVFVAGFVRGFVGFGAAMILIMALSVFLGPRAAVAIASIAGIVTTMQLLPDAVRLSDRSFAIPFGLASFVAAPFGTLVLVTVDPDIMKMAISVFVLIMVVMMYRGWQFGRGNHPATIISTGLASGLVQGSAGIGGPLAVSVALSRPGSAQLQRANVIGAVTALTFCAMIPMWYHGFFTRDVIVVGCLIMPPYVFSTWLGQRFFSNQGQHIFRAAALWVLAIMGAATLGLAVRDYMAG